MSAAWSRVILDRQRLCAGCSSWVATGTAVLQSPDGHRVACDAACQREFWATVRDGMKP